MQCKCCDNENESSFRPLLCTYTLNWARRTSWGWWDDWDDTVLQTQDSKFEPWRSEAEHATSRSRRLPTILTFTRGWERTAETRSRTPDSGVKGSGANHYPRAPSLQVLWYYFQHYNVLLFHGRMASITSYPSKPEMLNQWWSTDGGPALIQH